MVVLPSKRLPSSVKEELTKVPTAVFVGSVRDVVRFVCMVRLVRVFDAERFAGSRDIEGSFFGCGGAGRRRST